MSYRPYRHGLDRPAGRDSLNTEAASSLPPDRLILEGLSPTPIKALERPTKQDGKDVVIKDLEYIGSYDWTDERKPTIIVPGSPPVWRDVNLPLRVQLDSGIHFVDQNAYRMPSSSLYPLFRAVDIVEEETGESLDWTKVDFVTDRNSLRKLLRWISDSDGSAKEFRIDTHLAGARTVLFERWEKRTSEVQKPGIRTYGHNFPQESTTPAVGCHQGTDHHRIVKYDIDGLILVVRFSVDACLPSSSGRRPAAASTSAVGDLTDLLSGLEVSTSSRAALPIDSTASTAELDVICSGTKVLQESTIEIMTRSKNFIDQFDWDEAYPQLWLSQTVHHFVAVHERGTFKMIIKHSLGDPALQSIERKLQGSFRKLRKALEIIQDLVAEHGRRGALTLLYQNGQLRVYKRTNEDSSYLPQEVLDRFDIR